MNRHGQPMVSPCEAPVGKTASLLAIKQVFGDHSAAVSKSTDHDDWAIVLAKLIDRL